MSIDEAIRQFNYDAKCNRADLDLSYAEDNEQIAEWLEELKSIKDGSIPIIHGKAELELHDKAIRNEAIDDFVHKVKEHHYLLSDVINSTDYGMFTVGIEQIAEELKAGGKE